MKEALSLTRKELDGYFGSPMALIFVGVFLAATLFSFFWVDAFWARGTADVRPLFRAMPVLMIFLVAALTMRQWSEEQVSGTLELLLTMPLRLVQLVLGKFLSVLLLMALALLLTVFLPLTVSIMGNLDFGPVIGGYVAALLLASAYIAIGLFVSSRTDNQIVALIITVLVCGAFHMVGTATVTDLFDDNIAEILRAMSTSSRFESIERGVIDLRDLIYYGSLTVFFLVLNVVSLDSRRWSQGARMASYRLNMRVMVLLVGLNLVALNVVLFPLNGVRLDLTENGVYTLSDATREILENLQEPLLIRGYFSEKNHPLLEPLVPQVKDMLEEYEIASNGNLEIDFLDPIEDPDLEAEANQTYGITPTPLQVADRTGSSVLNVYFDLLIRYGDQSEVLNFSDLIEIEDYGANDFEVRLRNLEYDLTSSIKRVVQGFQSVDAVLASLDQPATLTLYWTAATLPESLAEVPQTIQTVADDLVNAGNGQFIFNVVDVNDPNDSVTPDSLFNNYGIQAIAAGFFSPETYYLHMVLQDGDQAQVLYPSGTFSEAEIRTTIESGLKRFSSGFLQVIGIWRPPDEPTVDQFGQQIASLSQYTTIDSVLSENYEVRSLDLADGQVPGDIDVLLVIAPQQMTELQKYAIDQFLMRGGSVMVAANSYLWTVDPYQGSFALEPIEGAIDDLLASYGVTVEDALVLDTQNEPFPVQVQRNVSGMVINEIQALDYPHFVDVRTDGMDTDSPILTDIPAITMNWVSPVTVAEDVTDTEDMNVTTLLKSTDNTWTTTDLTVIPDFDTYPNTGYPVIGERGEQVLAVALEGRFSSYYADHDAPFEGTVPEDNAEAVAQLESLASVGKLTNSPENSRLVVVGSAEFLNDNVFSISSSLSGDRYLNSLRFVQNAVDWFVEDSALATIRARGSGSRLLDALTDAEQSRWEAINYALALVSLLVLGVVWRLNKGAEQPMELIPPLETESSADVQPVEEGGAA